jgi:hypothetical protein
MDTESTNTVEEAQPADEAKGLRAQLEATIAENKALKAEKLRASFEALGLSPDTGLGKAIAKEYDGEISTEALAVYAKDEYGWEGEVTASNPVAPAIQAGNERLEQIAATSGSVPVPSQQDELAQAEAEGDWQKAMALKGERVAEAMRPRL